MAERVNIGLFLKIHYFQILKGSWLIRINVAQTKIKIMSQPLSIFHKISSLSKVTLTATMMLIMIQLRHRASKVSARLERKRPRNCRPRRRRSLSGRRCKEKWKRKRNRKRKKTKNRGKLWTRLNGHELLHTF